MAQQKEISFSWSELTTPPIEYEFGYNLRRFELIRQAPPPQPFDISEMVIKIAINSAIYLKQTTIPSKFADLTEKTVAVGSVVEQV